MSDEINDLQFNILDALYFVEPYQNILDEVEEPEPVIRDELRSMIDKGWVHVMAFDEEKGDYVKSPIYDTDNMQDYAYLASKKGLLRHNGYG
jgi:hypothetical protein